MPDRINEANLMYVVGEHERRLSVTESRTEDMPLLRAEVTRTAQTVDDLRDDMDSLRKALYAFALSIAGSALIFALTLFAVFK